MKRKCYRALMVVLLTLCILMVSGCEKIMYRKGTLGYTGYYEAYEIAVADVPFFADLGDDSSKFDQVRIVEQDAFGRTLYEYRSGAYLPNQNSDLVSLIICQKSSDSYAYYYEDYSYISRLDVDDDFSEAQIDAFKTANDWNRPIDNSKLSSVCYDGENHRDAYAKLREIPKEFTERVALAISEYENIQISAEDIYTPYKDAQVTSLGDRLYIAECGRENESRYYLVMYNERTETSVTALKPLDFSLSCQDTIHAMKESVG